MSLDKLSMIRAQPLVNMTNLPVFVTALTISEHTGLVILQIAAMVMETWPVC